jgi:hypothetical protein
MNKTKPKKFTFRNGPKATGLATVGAGTPSIDVNYAGIKVGYIDFNDSWNSNRSLGIRVNLMIPKEPKEQNPDDSASFKWGHLAKKFFSGDEAKTYLNENFEKYSKMVFIYGKT